MGLWGSIFKAVSGAAEVVVGAFSEIAAPGNPMGIMMIAGGAMSMATGIYGAVASGNTGSNGKQKNSTAVRDAISPWNVIYGQIIHGGATVYMNTWGSDTPRNFGSPTTGPAVPIMLDIVNIMAAHKCKSMDKVFFDRKMLQLNTTWIPTNANAGYTLIRQPDAGAGTSFSPLNNGETATGILHITRGYDPSGGFDSPGLVIVTLNTGQSIPYLSAGDQITIKDITGDRTLNGTYQVAQILAQSSPGFTTKFSYLNGGNTATVDNEGSAVTNWANFSWTAYIEPMLGTQTLGQTFAGMSAGTTWQGNGKLVSPISPGPAGGTAYTSQQGGGPWVNNCSLVGMTAIMVRLNYDTGYHENGVPQISILISGKSDIFDPRLSGGAGGYAYTANAALVIADFLSNPIWGYGAAYGTEIPLGPLTDAANICDQQIAVVRGGTENCYECNGTFNLNQTRGEVLADLLTSCGGRLIYVNGQYIIMPATPPGAGSNFYIYSGTTGHIISSAPLTPAYDLQAHALGSPEWKPTVSIRDLYNGVKGVYVSADNNYESSDIPPYMQDTDHGYPGTPYTDINLTADGGQRRFLNIHLPFTTSSSMAQRLAKTELLRRRWPANSAIPGLQGRGSGTFVCDCSAYQFVPTDVITVNCAFFGWTNKVMEVCGVRLKASNELALFVELDLIEVDSSIHAWTTAEELNPQGYQQSAFPKQTFVESVPLPWSPGYVSPLAGDVFEGGPASFGVQPVYGSDASGSPTANLQITGYAPLNNLDQDISSPLISCVGSGSGSSLAAGDYVVGLSSRSASSPPYSNSEYLDVATVTITAGQNIVVTITWQPGDSGGDLYMGEYAPGGNYVFHHQQNVAANAATATITSFDQTTPGGPDDRFDHFGLSFQQVVHAGVFAAQIVSVTATTVTLNCAGMTVNLWAGYTLSLLAKYSATAQVPVLNMPIASNTASDGFGNFVLTIGANTFGHTLPSLTAYLATDDLVVMRMYATFTASSFTDANINNPYEPGGAIGVEAGHVAVVMTGADAGDVQTISSVSGGTTFNLAASWAITPATGDIVIICAPSNLPEVLGSSLSITNPLATKILHPSIQNLANMVYLFTIRTEDENGNHCSDLYAPMREVFLFGSISGAAAVDTTPYGPNGGISFSPYGDPLYPQAVSNLSVGGQVQSDGSVLVSVKVSPVVPASALSTLTGAPIIDGTFTVSSTGGTIPGPQSVFVSLVAVDSAGSFTALSNQITCVIPSGTTGSIALTIDNYTSAMVNFLVYVGLNQEILYYRYTVSAAGTLTLTSIATVTGNSYGMPDSNFDHFVIGTTKIALAAVPLPATTIPVPAVMVVTGYTWLGGPLEKVTIAGAAFTPSALIGRTLSFVQLVSGQTFPVDFLITANDATSITVDIQSPPVGWVGSPATLTVGDLVCVRMQPTITSGGTVVADGLLALTANQFQGYVLRVFFADGSNESSFVVSNTSDALTVQADNPFTGSNPVWFWVEAGSFSALVPTTPAQVGSYSSSGIPLSVPIDNLPGFVGIQEFASNDAGALSPAGYSPIRDILFLGQAGTGGGVTVTVTTTATIAPNVSTVLMDASAGAFTVTLPTPSAMLYPVAMIRKDSTTNVVSAQHATGTIQGAATLAIDNAVLKSVTLVALTATTSKIQSFYGTTSGSSAVYTIYDPRYYSGDPTGATDATAAVASAIAAGGLFLDFGTKYSTTLQAIVSPPDNFQIWGGGSLVLAAAAGTSLLTISTATNIQLDRFIADGNSATGAGNPVIALTSITQGSLTTVRVKGGQGLGIKVLTSTKLQFGCCNTSACATPALSVDDPTTVNVDALCTGMAMDEGN